MAKLNNMVMEEPVELDEDQLESVTGGIEELELMRCPNCGSFRVRKNRTPGRGAAPGFSYYKCLDCGNIVNANDDQQ